MPSARVGDGGRPREAVWAYCGNYSALPTSTQLRKTIAGKNKELAQLRADVPALVRAVNQLTMENQQLRDMHGSPGGSVVPFRGRTGARPRN